MSEDKKHSGAIAVDIDLVRQLAAVLDDTQLTEIEVEDGDRRVEGDSAPRRPNWRLALQCTSVSTEKARVIVAGAMVVWVPDVFWQALFLSSGHGGDVSLLQMIENALVGPLVAVAVILHNAIGLAGGYGVGRLLGFDQRVARTIAIEVG